jgi:molecular chaperone GrpE
MKQRNKKEMKKDDPRDIPITIDGDDEELDADKIIAAIDKDEQSASADEKGGAATTGDPASNDNEDAAARLQSQIEALNQEKTALYDQLLRRQAEFENYRKRVERERSEVYQRARSEVLLELLPIVDNFERALSSLEKGEGEAAALRQGVELIHRQFNDALAKFGLEPVEAVGQTFDPHLHEAVTTEPTDEHEENTVIEEFERGYKIGDKLLRPAKVKVAASREK